MSQHRPDAPAANTPLEVARAFAAGAITRDDALHTLVTWPYRPEPARGPEYDDIGPTSDVMHLVEAPRLGYIDEDFYQEIADAVTARPTQET